MYQSNQFTREWLRLMLTNTMMMVTMTMTMIAITWISSCCINNVVLAGDQWWRATVTASSSSNIDQLTITRKHTDTDTDHWDHWQCQFDTDVMKNSTKTDCNVTPHWQHLVVNKATVLGKNPPDNLKPEIPTNNLNSEIGRWTGRTSALKITRICICL